MAPDSYTFRIKTDLALLNIRTADTREYFSCVPAAPRPCPRTPQAPIFPAGSLEITTGQENELAAIAFADHEFSDYVTTVIGSFITLVNDICCCFAVLASAPR